MIKEYCDICGKEAKTNKYVLPEWTDDYAKDKNGMPLLKINAIKPVEKDICKGCADVIARIVGAYTKYKKTKCNYAVDIDGQMIIIGGKNVC